MIGELRLFGERKDFFNGENLLCVIMKLLESWEISILSFLFRAVRITKRLFYVNNE